MNLSVNYMQIFVNYIRNLCKLYSYNNYATVNKKPQCPRSTKLKPQAPYFSIT
jgi:hypothetical protein